MTTQVDEIEVGDTVRHPLRGEMTVEQVGEEGVRVIDRGGIRHALRVEGLMLLEKADGTVPGGVPQVSPVEETEPQTSVQNMHNEAELLPQEALPSEPESEPAGPSQAPTVPNPDTLGTGKVTVNCALCGTPKEVVPSKLNHNKSGLFFCDKPHRALYMKEHPVRRRKRPPVPREESPVEAQATPGTTRVLADLRSMLERLDEEVVTLDAKIKALEIVIGIFEQEGDS